ncbi:SirB1 family protein [Coralloluteibacterium thermophilus]|uniref:SirB1 family protein n=1 Tax=Coralloluteibacterium thermophilum TaxID=2707049 RepID=A0ABV9NGP7_9GAMM
MDRPKTLPDWDALATLADDDVPLLDTALLVARDEYPDLDPELYRERIAGYAAALRPRVEALEDPAAKMAAINRYLFEELGFAGDADRYYDPRNSYLNDVFDRRRGIPLSLAMVQMSLARALDVPLDGVSFPGHFLVSLAVDDGVLVMDPFNRGRSVGADELKQRATPHLGGQTPDDELLFEILAPASNRAIVMRMLRNLKSLYAEGERWEKVARCADRQLKLAPGTLDGLRDRGLAYLRLGHAAGAREDLGRYLSLAPGAADADAVRNAIIEAGQAPVRLH